MVSTAKILVPGTAELAACENCPVRHQSVCALCLPEELETLEQLKYHRHYEAGQTIVWAGDEMNFVGSVVEGVATLSHTLQDGRKQMVGLLLASDFIGRPGRRLSSYDVTAVTDVTLCCFRRKPFEQLISSTPNVAERLLDMSLDELAAAREWMLILGRKTAREKIASFLTILAQRAAKAAGTTPTGAMTIDLPLTREAMADYLGLTLETVSRQISALKNEGLITLGGKRRVDIPDLHRLVTEAGGSTEEDLFA